MELEILTYSAGTTLCHCEQKYYWRYELCLRPKREDGEALWIGSAMHAGLEAYSRGGEAAGMEAVNAYATLPTIGQADTLRLQERCAKARAMVRAAAAKWPDFNSAGSLTEHVLTMPIRNPKGRARSRSFEFRGVLDGLADGVLHDWKSTSDPQRAIREYQIGHQTDLYVLGLREQGTCASGAQFRFIETPAIKFQQAGQPTKKWGGDAAAYEQACLDGLLQNADRMVEFDLHVNEGRIKKAQWWLWSCSKRILSNRSTGIWLTNEKACHTWNRTCEYASLCEADSRGDDWRWIAEQEFEKADPHPELSRLQELTA